MLERLAGPGVVQRLQDGRLNAQRLLDLLRRNPGVVDVEVGRCDLVRGEKLLDLVQSERRLPLVRVPLAMDEEFVPGVEDV